MSFECYDSVVVKGSHSIAQKHKAVCRDYAQCPEALENALLIAVKEVVFREHTSHGVQCAVWARGHLDVDNVCPF